MAFEISTQPRIHPIEREARIRLRKVLREKHVLKRIAKDIEFLFDTTEVERMNRMDAGELWDGNEKVLRGGVNYGETQ